MNAHPIAAPWRRALLLPLIAGSIALLQGCATKPQAQYKVYFCNRESAPVSDVRVNYGGALWEVPALPASARTGDEKCLGGYAITTIQVLPEGMALTWVLGGRRQEAAMPIKSRLNGIYPTNGIQVIFHNDRVEVFEYVYPANNHLVRRRIYPPVAPKPAPAPKRPIQVAQIQEHGVQQNESTLSLNTGFLELSKVTHLPLADIESSRQITIAHALAQSDDTSHTLKIGYAAIKFDANSCDLTGPPGTTPGGARTEIDNARTGALVYEHRVSGPWSFVAQIGVPPTLNFKGAGTGVGLGQIGSAKAWFPAALVTYTFAGPQALRPYPYVGAGVNYTFFTQGQTSPAYNGAVGGTSRTVDLKAALGAVAKLGLEIPLSNKWVLDIAYARYWVKTTAAIVTATPGVGNIERKVDIKATPDACGVFLGYRL